MPETPAFLAERLKTEGEKTVAFFDTLTDSQWQSTLYSEDETWTMRDVLAHFVMSEKALFKLFTSIQTGGAGVPENFSIDSENAAHQQQTREQSAQELVAQFKTIRAELTDWVSTLSAADLEKTGRHPFLGVTTLAEMVKMIYRHNQIHIRDVKRVISE